MHLHFKVNFRKNTIILESFRYAIHVRLSVIFQACSIFYVLSTNIILGGLYSLAGRKKNKKRKKRKRLTGGASVAGDRIHYVESDGQTEVRFLDVELFGPATDRTSGQRVVHRAPEMSVKR